MRLILIGLLSLLVGCTTTPSFNTDYMADRAVQIVDLGSAGSGIHLNNGFILTCKHVCKGMSTATMIVKAGDQYGLVDKYVYHKVFDLCLLKTDLVDLPQTRIEYRDEMLLGQDIFYMGFYPINPDTSLMAINTAEVRSIIYTGLDTTYSYMLDNFAIPGMSGSGVLNHRGNIVGIIQWADPMNPRSGAVVLPNIRKFMQVIPPEFYGAKVEFYPIEDRSR
jgi:S1-C subfamily serine protease